ncbi:MAG: hypothetical protein ABSF64_36115 [Bryobacteraceae bacterium]|jgi:hypothetical protein
MSPWQLLAHVTLGALFVPLCAAQTGFSTLHSFTGENGDDGVLYGTTGGGGICCGTVFRWAP